MTLLEVQLKRYCTCHVIVYVIIIAFSVFTEQTITKCELIENERIPVYNPTNEEITAVTVNRLSNQVRLVTYL